MEFNGIKASNIDGVSFISPPRHPLLAENKDEYADIPNRDGSILMADSTKKNILLECDLFLKGSTPGELLEIAGEVAKWLDVDEYKKLEFGDGKYYLAKPVMIPFDRVEEFDEFADVTVTFSCFPFKFGEKKTIPLSNSPVKNNGNYKSPPLIEVKLTESVSKLEIDVNGIKITLTDTLKNNDIITIDTNELEVRVNGNLKVLEVEGYFSFLKSGDNEISVNANGTATVKYQEYYYL